MFGTILIVVLLVLVVGAFQGGDTAAIGEILQGAAWVWFSLFFWYRCCSAVFSEHDPLRKCGKWEMLADGCSTPKAPQGRPQTSQISAFRHKVRQYPLVAPHNSLANA
jgi:hypothetical protein